MRPSHKLPCASATIERASSNESPLAGTIRSNLSVGMPIDILLYERDSLDVRRSARIEADDEYFRHLSSAWSDALRTAFRSIDEFKL